ncbi:hypothetical protein HK405_008270, partial [Cladochytrium tenue]
MDGGLATQLEADGKVLSDSLWSASLLLDDPTSIKAVHRRYLDAGADIVTTATYQASPKALLSRSPPADPRHVFRLAVDLAREAVVEHVAASSNRRPTPLVAASLGSYGATLADGSEFTGNFQGASHADLVAFHAERIHIAVDSQPDLLAFETVPSQAEVSAILDALATCAATTAADAGARSPLPPSWISLSCRPDGALTNAGDHLRDVSKLVAERGPAVGVFALGLNCTAPRAVLRAVTELRAGMDSAASAAEPLEIVVY